MKSPCIFAFAFVSTRADLQSQDQIGQSLLTRGEGWCEKPPWGRPTSHTAAFNADQRRRRRRRNSTAPSQPLICMAAEPGKARERTSHGRWAASPSPPLLPSWKLLHVFHLIVSSPPPARPLLLTSHSVPLPGRGREAGMPLSLSKEQAPYANLYWKILGTGSPERRGRGLGGGKAGGEIFGRPLQEQFRLSALLSF